MKKKKKPDDDIKTISSFHPFNNRTSGIISFMCDISKNIYNTSIFCHQIYDLFYNSIYARLLVFCQMQKRKMNSEPTDDEKKNLLDTVHNKLILLFSEYHAFYCKHYKDIKNNSALILHYLICKNKLDPIVNSNYEQYIIDTCQFVMSNKYIVFSIDTYWMVKKYILEIINWLYLVNFKTTRNEIRNKMPVTIKNKIFIENVKSNMCLLNEESIDRNKNKLKIEKLLNIKLFSDQYIIKKATYAHLNDNKEYLPADVILNIIDKSYEAYKSYLALKQKGIKCNRQHFLKKGEQYNLFYTKSSFKLVKKKGNLFIRLSLGSYVSKKYIDLTNDKKLVCLNNNEQTNAKVYVDKKYLTKTNIKQNDKKKYYCVDNKYIKKTDKHIIQGNYMFIKVPKKIVNKNIKLLNIVPIYDGYKYKVCFAYEKEEQKMLEFDEKKIGNYVSVDFGVKNLMVIYDPDGNKQIIISGSEINSINFYYNKRIDAAKSILMTRNKKYTSNKVRELLIKRENKITDYFHKLCSWFTNEYAEKKCVVIGYNPNWKTNTSMGKENNRKFYEIPYKKLIGMLENKLNNEGKILAINEESYTSKCDALGMEEICKHEKYMGTRLRRGIFASSKGKLINADLNGAINILRKYMKRKGYEIKKINEKGIYNPKKIRKL